jgi:hypothetical protein
MPKLGTTIWDATLARRLYDEGASFTQIGVRIGVAPSLIGQFAARHGHRRDPARKPIDVGETQRSVAPHLQCHQATISRLSD